MDPSRFTSLRRCDFARDIPDVYSPSIWDGWYSGVYTDYESALEKERATWSSASCTSNGALTAMHAVTPNCRQRSAAQAPFGADLAETTPDSLQTGAKAAESHEGDWSETYACDLFDWYLKVQETLPWLPDRRNGASRISPRPCASKIPYRA